MRYVLLAAVGVAVIAALADEQLAAQPPVPGDPAPVAINSQKSLADVVGNGFAGDAAWEYPTELLPADFPGLAYVSGPADPGLGPKGAWRKPVALRDKAAGVEVAVNCYRARGEPEKGAGPGTPAAPLLEPDYRYAKAAFHGLRAATASDGGREAFAFRDGDLLFKFEAAGGEPEARRVAAATAAESVWKFRHPK